MNYDGKKCPICHHVGLAEKPIEDREYHRPEIKHRGKNAGKFLGIILAIVLVLIAVPFGIGFLDDTNYFPSFPLFGFDKIAELFPREGKNYDLNLGEGLEFEQEEKTKSEQTPKIPINPDDPEKQIEQTPFSLPEIIPKKSQSEILQFAVEQINNDRKERGLMPVLLSNNKAAQIHAEDILKHGTISHWLSIGEKPYVTFTKNGGNGNVGQNVAISTCQGFCTGFDVEKQIKDQEYSMMYDDASSNWGHRDNIIDPHHTHVSLGIAYNNNMFVYVQNFEDNYLDGSIQFSNNLVKINGNLQEGKILNIGIYYDPLPSTQLYELHKNDGFYEMGDLLAIVERPLPPNSYYNEPSDYQLIVANNWKENGKNISIDFDTSKVFSSSGVYTIGIWIENKGDTFLITSYSILTG